jgi:hypothetical protein
VASLGAFYFHAKAAKNRQRAQSFEYSWLLEKKIFPFLTMVIPNEKGRNTVIANSGSAMDGNN